METKEIKIWVMVDDMGNHAIGEDTDQVTERFREDVDTEPVCVSCFAVTLTLPVPEPVVLNGRVIAPDTVSPVLSLEQVVS